MSDRALFILSLGNWDKSVPVLSRLLGIAGHLTIGVAAFCIGVYLAGWH